MNKKIVGIGIAVILVISGLLGLRGFLKNHSVTGQYYPTNYSSLFITPSSANGDTYTLAWGTSAFGTATTLIDSLGNWVGTLTGTINSTSTAHVGSFVSGGTSTVVNTTSTVTGPQLCTSSNFSVINTTGTITFSFPTAASTTAAGCMSADNDFYQFFILQNSTNTIKIATSTGDTMFKDFNSSSSYTLASTTPVHAIVDVLRVSSSSYSYFVHPVQ